jgi:hypothetical protein
MVVSMNLPIAMNFNTPDGATLVSIDTIATYRDEAPCSCPMRSEGIRINRAARRSRQS